MSDLIVFNGISTHQGYFIPRCSHHNRAELEAGSRMSYILAQLTLLFARNLKVCVGSLHSPLHDQKEEIP